MQERVIFGVVALLQCLAIVVDIERKHYAHPSTSFSGNINMSCAFIESYACCYCHEEECRVYSRFAMLWRDLDEFAPGSFARLRVGILTCREPLWSRSSLRCSTKCTLFTYPRFRLAEGWAKGRSGGCSAP